MEHGQRPCRVVGPSSRVGATLMVATTHTDMVDDLAPNLYIEKKYREKIKIVRSPEGYKHV